MRRAARLDDNQGAIVEALEAMSWGVWSTAGLGRGFPDLLIVKAGRMLLLEVKDGSKSKSRRALTEDEIAAHLWFQAHGAPVLVIEKVEDLQVLDRQARALYEER